MKGVQSDSFGGTAPIELLPPAAQEIVSQYAPIDAVRAIAVIGSLTRTDSDRHSDADLMIVFGRKKDIPSPEARVETIRSISEYAIINTVDYRTRVFGRSEDFVIDGQEVCTQFFTTRKLEKNISKIIGGKYLPVGMEDPLAFLNSVNTALPIVDKDNIYQGLQSQVRPYPAKLQEHILAHELDVRLPYYRKCLEIAIQRNDVPYLHATTTRAVESALQVLFSLYKVYPKGPKKIYQQLMSFMDPDSFELVKKCVEELYASKGQDRVQMLDNLLAATLQSKADL